MIIILMKLMHLLKAHNFVTFKLTYGMVTKH